MEVSQLGLWCVTIENITTLDMQSNSIIQISEAISLEIDST